MAPALHAAAECQRLFLAGDTVHMSATLRYVSTSPAYATSLAENYVGIPEV
ncbi:hypothetical protein HCA58_08260 [Micromonospora sp. HNM0581]|uniref:hypothetical protein n=1 Tax=Micromonospora sp. HNM0581 TaxID=2716341 RepID=UPI00146E6427|nr:hypothetical protein [Micromonospora sp. HNM0581]NLU78369.1 hypothetical protein [Micromonospora sp. HNM0581]